MELQVTDTIDICYKGLQNICPSTDANDFSAFPNNALHRTAAATCEVVNVPTC